MMAERMDTDLISREYKTKSKLENESIVVPKKVAAINLITTEEQLGKQSLSPDQDVCDLHPATGAYSSLYCSTSFSLPLSLIVYLQLILLLRSQALGL